MLSTVECFTTIAVAVAGCTLEFHRSQILFTGSPAATFDGVGFADLARANRRTVLYTIISTIVESKITAILVPRAAIAGLPVTNGVVTG